VRQAIGSGINQEPLKAPDYLYPNYGVLALIQLVMGINKLDYKKKAGKNGFV
jgi:hypothetical protein